MSKASKGTYKGNSIQSPFDGSTSTAQPKTYEHDDTPKAFKRMMQLKTKMAMKHVTTSTKPTIIYAKPSTVSKPTSESLASKTAQNLIKFAESATRISAKKKAYHKKRDDRKRAKKQNSALERDFHSSRTIVKDVRDIVKEPPKSLPQPKKVFKKEIQKGETDEEDEGNLSGFSDFDADAVDFDDSE